MKIGDVLHLSSLPQNKDYEVVTAPETVVAVLHPARTSELDEVQEEPEEKESEEAEPAS